MPPPGRVSTPGTVEQSPTDAAKAAALSEACLNVYPSIPGYEIEGELGRGGMGVVFLATHLRFSRRAAIKMLLGGQYTDTTTRVRFLVEAEAVAQLAHPNIVGVHEFGQHEGQPYFSLEYVSGGTLAEKLTREGPLPPQDAAKLVAKLADAMVSAHSKGIVHRDLKPANVLLTAEGEPKITDFGLAKVGNSDMTVSGAVMGTPSYMSPEQASGKTREIGTATDVYALGAILYELLAGRPTFRGDSMMDTIRYVLTREPTPLRAADPRIPRDLETICLKCLEKDAKKRYATAAELQADLQSFLSGRPITARPVGSVERVFKWGKRHPTRALAVTFGAVLLVVAGVVAFEVERAMVQQQLAAVKQRADDRIEAEKQFAEVTRQKSRETRAESLVQALNSAETAGVPRLLEDLKDFHDLTEAKLREMATQPANTRAGLHARLALLPDEPQFAKELAEYLPMCRPFELLAIRELLKPYTAVVAPSLQAVLTDDRATAGMRVRAAAALAGLMPDRPEWKHAAPHLVEQLVQENPLEVAIWARALQPVRLYLVPVLLKRYPESRLRMRAGKLDGSELAAEASSFDLTANLLASFIADRPVELAELVMFVDARHHRLFEPEIVAEFANIAPVLRQELTKRIVPDFAAPEMADVPFDAPIAAVASVAVERCVTIPDTLRRTLARRQANAAAVLLKLGEPETVWPLLKFPADGDPSLRSYLIQRLAGIGANPVVLIRRFYVETDLTVRRALVVALGDYSPSVLPMAVREPFIAQLLYLYQTDPDAGLHSAIDWLLRQQWGRAKQIASIDTELTAKAKEPSPAKPEKGWFVNGQGQTYSVVRGPVEFVMGSRVTVPGRVAANEPAHRKRISRSFAIATKEVTNEEFLRYEPKHSWVERYSPDRDSPAVSVTMYAAAGYCNWLSEREGIPEDQWCYKPNAEGKYAEGMTMKPGHLNLKGYRLPTEAEWEYVSHAGSTVARYFGRSEELLPRYTWYVKNADDRAWPVGRLRPNEWGLFDVLGNALEWVEDPGLLYNTDQVEDVEHKMYLEIDGRMRRLLRGGAFDEGSALLRCGDRLDFVSPSNRFNSNGFRPIRTLP
ncbi:MAG: protein kinase [Planctomycetes bacterium]|nr:protein kinase [Planctomycetota bacterium]